MDTSRSSTHYGKGEKIMMMLEQKLAQTDLSKYKKSPKERFAEQICLYRKFKTKEAMKRIDCWKEIHSEATAKWYFDESMRYLTSGITLLNPTFVSLLDKYKDNACKVPEKPEFERTKGRGGRGRKKIDVPVKRITNPIKADVCEKFNYGIRFNGCCMMSFENELLQEMFLKGLEMAKIIKDYKKIHIKADAISEVE